MLGYTQTRGEELKYRTCAQNVSDVLHRFYILGRWPTP
jgi:hypothetical protein